MPKIFPVFRAGDYGKKGTYSPEDVKQLFEKYDPDFLSAPFTVDHKQDGPAFGYARVLKFKNDTLFASADDLADVMKNAIKEKHFNRVSVEIYKDLPEKGRYLKAISFLGVKAPAVKGFEGEIANAAFADAEAETIEFEVEWVDDEAEEFALFESSTGDKTPESEEFASKLGSFIKKKRDELNLTNADLGKAAGIDESTVGQIIAGEIQRPPEKRIKGFAKVLKVSEEELKKMLPAANLEELAAENERLQQQISDLESQREALSSQFAATEAEREQAKENLERIRLNTRRMEFESWLNERVAFGNLTPANKKKVMDILVALDSIELFEAGEKQYKPLDLFKSFVDSLPKIIDEDEKVKKPEEGYSSEAEDIARRAREYQRQQFEQGKKISVAEAVTYVTKNQEQ